MRKTRIEIFDVQTDTTFVSVHGESIGIDGGCGAVAAQVLVAARNNLSGPKSSTPAATSSSVLGGAVSPKPRSAALAAAPQTPRGDFYRAL
jgi:hypothetical protein